MIFFFLAPEVSLLPLIIPIQTLVLKALKKDKDMLALVFDWNPAGFNDVATAPGLRNGVAGQNVNAIIANLVANGARNHNNNVVFTFANGAAIGAWKSQITANIPWYES